MVMAVIADIEAICLGESYIFLSLVEMVITIIIVHDLSINISIYKITSLTSLLILILY